MANEKYSTAYCATCAENFRIVVSEDDEILIACECAVEKPQIFIDELQDQLPLPSEEKFDKINKKKKPDRDSSKGFQ